jgi:hypothetical protein
MDASMDLWASQSPLPSWWNAALLPTTATQMVVANRYGSQGVLGANWNTIEGMNLPFYITQGIPGNIAATGVSDASETVGVVYDALGNVVAVASVPAGGAVATQSNALKYIVYITIALVVLIILYKIFFSKPAAPQVQYVQTAPAGDEE